MHNNPSSSRTGDLIALADYSERDKPWDRHKLNSERLAYKYKSLGYEKYPESMLECADWLSFKITKPENSNGFAIKLYSARFCRLRFCSTCQWRKSQMWVARLYNSLPKMLEDYPKIRFLFLTLTVPNCELENLNETIKKMNAAWVSLCKWKAYPGIGYLKSLEVVPKLNSKAHPHFHIIIAVDDSYFKSKKYLDETQWRELWQKALRTDERRVIDIRRVKPKGKRGDSKVDKLINALRECVKYTTKSDDLLNLPLDELDIFTNQMNGLRSISLGGIFKDYMREKEPENLIDENEEKDDNQIEGEISAKWIPKNKRYYLSDK